MTITFDQLQALAPYAMPPDLRALADGEDCSNHLSTTLAVHGLTEPGVIAQFLTMCLLASDGLVKFVTPQPLGSGRALFQTPEGWIDARAKDWQEWRLTEWAHEWDINYIADKWAERFEFARDYFQVWEKLQTVCDALGVENLSEKFALDD